MTIIKIRVEKTLSSGVTEDHREQGRSTEKTRVKIEWENYSRERERESC